jgi:hypothetical protein
MYWRYILLNCEWFMQIDMDMTDDNFQAKFTAAQRYGVGIWSTLADIINVT